MDRNSSDQTVNMLKLADFNCCVQCHYAVIQYSIWIYLPFSSDINQ